MAKSGIYLNGEELLVCELEKLPAADRDKAYHETMTGIRNELNDIKLGVVKLNSDEINRIITNAVNECL